MTPSSIRRRLLAAMGLPGVGVVAVAACQGAPARGPDVVVAQLADGGEGALTTGDASVVEKVAFCERDELREAACVGSDVRGGVENAGSPYAECSQRMGTGAPIARRYVGGTPHTKEGTFDPEVTAAFRESAEGKAVAAGESCCYSWCAAGLIRPAPDPPTDQMMGGNVVRSTVCIEAPEGGTSTPGQPADCPAAIESGGPISLDSAATEQRRVGVYAGLISPARACCYTRTQIRHIIRGRAFRPGGSSRAARASRSSAWLVATERLDVGAMPQRLRDRLAASRERDGGLEHAAVASFARTSLALLALGAPAALVAETHAAALDEVRHARDMFALASAYRGEPVSPSRLDVTRLALHDVTLVSFAVETFDDACVGETAGALVADEASRGALPPLRATLAAIAEEEARHAELAWRTVAWAVRVGGDAVKEALRARLGSLRPPTPAPVADDPDRDLMLAHGVLADGAERALVADAMRQVVLPCARALLG